VTSQHFVGPDGKTYSVNEPEEGGFFLHYDRKAWLITFPVTKDATEHRYYCGDRLPNSATEWRTRALGTRNPFPSFVTEFTNPFR
jgi:hypothetical protein